MDKKQKVKGGIDMRVWLIVGIVGFVLVVAGVVLVILWQGQVVSKSYEGKVVFETVSEYRQFKSAVGDKNVWWFEGNVLSSEPPIVVQFRAEAGPDYKFPYGEVTINTKLDKTVWHIACFFWGGAGLLIGTLRVYGNLHGWY